MSFTRKEVGNLVFNQEDYSIRHKATEEKLFRVEDLPYDRLAQNTIVIRVPIAFIRATGGLAADSTGVKATSNKALGYSRHLKKARLLSEVTSIPSDATVRIGLYNVTKGAYVLYRDYEGATGKNIDEVSSPDIADDDELEIRVEVTTASGTSGATFDVGECVAQLEYGVR